MKKRVRLCGALSLVLLTSTALGASKEIGPEDDIEAEINNLQAGDELILRGGTYSKSDRFGISVSGTEQAPIVIRAKDGETPIITRPDENQNTVNIENSSHLVFRGLSVTGGSIAIRMSDVSFITFEECEIYDTGDVAFAANISGNAYEGLRFIRNHIHDTGGTGEGFYLGCNDDACRMFNSVIEGNYVHHTFAGTAQGDGIEIKHGSHDNIIRDNVIHDTRYPCILVYGTNGNGGPNLIEGNAMWNCGDHAIQAASDAIIRNNLILGAAGNGIANQTHQGATPSNLQIIHNTIVNADTAIRSRDITGSILIANNAVYSQSGSAIHVSGDSSGVELFGNVGTGGVVGATGGYLDFGDLAVDFVDASWDASSLNVFPASNSALLSKGDPAYVTQVDFNGTTRDGVAHAGAYHYDESGNPGWAVQAGLKTSSGGRPPPPPLDGGTSGDAGTPPPGDAALSDGGTSGADSGPSGQDGGNAAPDAASPSPDAGASPDGTPDTDEGCSCTASPVLAGQNPTAALCSLALAFLCLRRRRR